MTPRRKGAAIVAAAVVAALVHILPADTSAAGSAQKRLAAGAFSVAAELYQQEESWDRARRLLQFGLALDPENVKGLLMQARDRRGLKPVAPNPSTSVRETYLKAVLGLAERTESLEHKLILYQIAETVDPGNEIALVALAQAENQGHTVAFDELLARIRGDDRKEPESTQAPEEPTDQPPPENGEDPPRPPTTVVEGEGLCRDVVKAANPMRHLGRKLGRSDVRSRLGTVRVDEVFNQGISVGELAWINKLNKVLFARGFVVIPYCNDAFELESVRFLESGIPEYAGRESRHTRLPAGLGHVTVGHVLASACAELGVAYRLERGCVLLVDPEQAPSDASAAPHEAAMIAKEFDRDPVGSLKKYRGRYILVSGTVSGSKKGVDGMAVYVADESVQLDFPRDSGIEEDRVAEDSFVEAIGRVSHNNMGTIVVVDCILREDRAIPQPVPYPWR